MICEFITNFFEYLWLAIWPILSIILGIIAGSILGTAITVIVFALTLVRTPLHIAKMAYVTIATSECFPGHLGHVLRFFVFFLVPVVHLLFLVGVTIFSATIGMCYYIGKSSQIFYNHEYKKTVKKIESNARLEPKSYLGKYIKKCQNFVACDEESYPTIYFLKGCVAFVPGVILGTLPILPYSFAMLGVTLIRLPINTYMTMKISLFTVVLKWDIKLLSIITLPFIQVLFPVTILISSMIWSLFYFTFQTSKSIFEGKIPFAKWYLRLKKDSERYYKAHQNFIDEHCNNYDHATRIPFGWDGRRYGIPVQKILRWQADFILCCSLMVLAAVVCFIGTFFLSLVKCLPSCVNTLVEIIKDYFSKGCGGIISMWPFYLIGMLLLPTFTILVYLLLPVGVAAAELIMVPYTYTKYGARDAFYEQIRMLCRADEITSYFCFEWSIYTCLKIIPEYPENEENFANHQTNERMEDEKKSELYWDRFVSQSIKTTAMLVEKKWISLENVQGLDPSVVQSIPSVALLTILSDSVNEEGLSKEDIKWTIDGTICKKHERPKYDDVASTLLPMILEIKQMLKSHKQESAKAENIQLIMAMLCSNGEVDPEALTVFMKENNNPNEESYTTNNQIRTNVINVVMAILRVKPYQERMKNIYTHEYKIDIEEGIFETLTENLKDEAELADNSSHKNVN